MVKIAPSILSADFGDLRREVLAVEAAGAEFLHLDIMDGHFVPNLTFGPMVVKQLRPSSKLVFETHLMVFEPEKMVPWFAEAGADVITIHAEAAAALPKTLALIKSLGKKAGVSLKPGTSEEILRPFLEDIDLILVMTVEPGFGGQKFMETQLDKIRRIKKMTENSSILIEVDGGINRETARGCIAAGADILVAGTAVFGGGDYRENIMVLKES